MKIYHLNILATAEDRAELNRVGWDGAPRFTMHADITCGMENAAQAAAAAFSEGFYKHVANVPAVYPTAEQSLETAFEVTNSIHFPWFENPQIEVLVDKARSTSVGDLMEHEGALYMVSPVGFTKLEGITA